MGTAIAILVVVVGLVGLIALLPKDFHIERVGLVEAPPHVVFAIVNDFHNWGRWSPYDSHDPNMEKTYDGPTSGAGAGYAWSGNDQVGAGRMTILESKPSELVSMRLQFIRPFAGVNQVDFILKPAAGGTTVTWAMDGKYNFITKVMSFVMNMDKMIGTDFEVGLAILNASTKADYVDSFSQHIRG